MKFRNALVLAALAFVLTACGSASITGPETSAPDQPTMSGGWAGGNGRAEQTDTAL
jgi:ABC-type glycerol-3-phosphate transport system substrate-binding protein